MRDLAPGGAISPMLDAQDVAYVGEVFYAMDAPTGGGVTFNINNGGISYFSEFGQSDGTVTYESLSGGAGGSILCPSWIGRER